MSASLQFALSNPVPGREDDFHDWYGGHHLYAAVATSGILAGQRFERIASPWPGGDHVHLALWELDDPPYALAQLAQIKGSDQMPMSDALDVAGIQPPTMWVRASVRNATRPVVDTTTRGTCILMLCRARAGEEAAFERVLLQGELANLADRPGVVSVDFLILAEQQIRNNARKIQFALLIELVDEAEGLSSLAGKLEALPHLDLAAWKAPLFRPLGRKVGRAEALRHLEAHAHGVAEATLLSQGAASA